MKIEYGVENMLLACQITEARIKTDTQNIQYLILLTALPKYFVARRQCKGNPLLRFHFNNEHIFSADSYTYANNN